MIKDEIFCGKELKSVSQQMFNDYLAFGGCGAVITPDGIHSATMEELENTEKELLDD